MSCGLQEGTLPSRAVMLQPDVVRTGSRVIEASLCEREPRTHASGSTRMSHTIEVTDATFSTKIDGSPGLIMVDCWAPWCMPCVALGPAIDQLAKHFAGRARIAKLNVDDSPQAAARLAVRSIPTLLFFRDGVLLDRIVGLVPRAEIAARIERHLETGHAT